LLFINDRFVLADEGFRFADERFQLAAEGFQLADGRFQLAAERFRLADGRRQLAAERFQLADGRCQLAAERFQLADGRFQLAAEGLQLVSACPEIEKTLSQIGERHPCPRARSLQPEENSFDKRRNSSETTFEYGNVTFINNKYKNRGGKDILLYYNRKNFSLFFLVKNI
jgi:hypothetical protein